MGKLQRLSKVVNRRRGFDTKRPDSATLKRCLNWWDLTSMAVGSTLGVGVYVLIGTVALKVAGPSIVLSFLIAGITAFFAGLCFAEFGSRVPLAGSAYVYAYVTVGELVAFVVAWNNILEFVFGAASVSRGLSMYVDSTINNSMSAWFAQTMPTGLIAISPYFDLFAFLFTLAVGIILVFGVRSSATVNNIFSAGNILVILFIVVVGAFKADPANWSIPSSEVTAGRGDGGFFPYGVWGTLQGAAICFYGFVGFDVINFCGEEVRSPRRSIPCALLCALLLISASYASVSIVVTMMVPYYSLGGIESVATAFTQVGWNWAHWVVTTGAICGICTSLFGSLYPVPRLLYSMAHDGLFFHWFGRVSDKNQSPIFATVIPTVLIAVLSGLLELEQLVLMTCVGSLVSYTIVAASVVLLRYRSEYMPESLPNYLKQVFGRGNKMATKTSSNVTATALVIYLCACATCAAVNVHSARPLGGVISVHAVTILVVLIMALQPEAAEKLSFKTPLVPFIPCLSIYININLMMLINLDTWVRVFIWILIGVPIYIICLCCYKQGMGSDRDNIKSLPNIDKPGKSPTTVQIVVVSPTPPESIAHAEGNGHHIPQLVEDSETQKQNIQVRTIMYDENIIVHKVLIEHNEEKEAKIMDLLDQVLQAEEDSYSEDISLKEIKDNTEATNNEEPLHRKSLSELSDAESDASLGNQGLSKYDVIAQVHREDLPKVNEEEEQIDINDDFPRDDYEEVTAFNDSETNSRTDESGYSDTIDRTPLNESIDGTKDAFHIPAPPPMDEEYFKAPNYKKFNTVSINRLRVGNKEDNNDDEEDKPRESISNKSNGSYSDENMRFGSDKQIEFMSKLNDIFQSKILPNDEEEPRPRSQSTGNVADLEKTVNRERPAIFLDLKKELLSREAADLRPVEIEVNVSEPKETEDAEEAEAEDISMSREDLKNKLENIFAAGGPQPLKPRLMKSNPPTPEDSYQMDTQSSTESLPKPKMEKNDTLKRQKAKFGAVLNSFRLSMNKDDDV